MSLLRFAARSMLASYFLVNGVRALRHPEELTAQAKPVADRVLPVLNSAVGDQLAGYLPEDPEGFVKCTGVLQIAGGLSLATGIGRRVGAGVLAVSLLPQVLWSKPFGSSPERTNARTQLGKNVALLGGVLLAAQDTEGRPDLAWKIRTQRELATKQAAKAEAAQARAEAAAEKAARRRGRRRAGAAS